MLLTSTPRIFIGNMQLASLNEKQLSRAIRQAVYNLSIAALLEKGAVKRDLLAVRDEMRSFLKRMAKGETSPQELYSELGFALISIAIIKAESKSDKVRGILSAIEDSFYGTSV